jgi:type II secretory pathway component PulM
MDAIKQHISNLKTRWNGLQYREQLLVICGLIFVGIVFFYALIWEPIRKTNDILKKSLPQLEKQLSEMRAMHAESPSWKKQPSSVEITKKVDQYLESASATHNINYEKLQFLDQNRIKIDIYNVNFNNVIRWLNDFQRNTDVRILQLDIDKASQDGYVNCRFEFLKP